MAEFPDMGAHCSVPECRQLDLLPIKCDACSLILCKEHRNYQSHRCKEAYKKEAYVPVCPLCKQPIPIKKGEIADIRVNEHIESDCTSDIAIKKKRAAPKCGMRKCLKRELVIMECKQCGIHFCLGHRHSTDHQCKGKKQLNKAENNEHDELLAKALHESLNMNVSQQMNPEQFNYLIAQQLQQEEYERAYGDGQNQLQQASARRNMETGNNNNSCTIS